MINDAKESKIRLNAAKALALEAGDILRRGFGNVSQVAFKGAVDLVTEIDQQTEAFLRGEIRAQFPQDGIWGEEQGLETSEDWNGWTWVVDPLDGTTNYVHRVPHFATSIGITFQQVPTVGVIHAPMRDCTYSACVGMGAFANGRPLRVSETQDLKKALLVTGFPYDRAQTAEALLGPVKRAFEQARGLRRHGAASLDFVDVAAGVFDGYWEPRLCPWDMAAGVVLLQEAGGTVSRYGGDTFSIDSPDVICSNGHLHEALIAMVRGDS